MLMAKRIINGIKVPSLDAYLCSGVSRWVKEGAARSI